jgi:lysophospholipase L1-like esterase
VVGWTQVPRLEWTWAGTHWYARDFSVRIRTNSLGFRDLERHPAKAEGTVRVALLGDSFVEAVQVPFEKTAGHLLELRLEGSRQSARFEVLNFGISNYGVGQYLLVWERFVSDFDPDYVVVLVGGFHMQRTLAAYEVARFHHASQRALWVRPTFRLQEGKLVREPALDYDAFLAAQAELIAGEFGGDRSRRRETSLLAHLAKALGTLRPAGAAPPGPAPAAGAQPSTDVLAVNLRILEELSRQIAARGGRLVIADGCSYFGAPSGSSEALQQLSRAHEIGYVPLGERLRNANQDGRATRFPYDGHFNETGNQVFAEALFEWLAQQPGDG